MSQALEDKVLLLVAGPSGSGKTVFINQYRSKTLPAELMELLPPEGQRWPQIGANDCMKRGVDLEAILPRTWEQAGGIVHYDTAYIHRFGLKRYGEDPGAELFRRVGRVTVVSIAPPFDRLKAQFDARRKEQRGKKKSSHLFWRDYVRTPLENLLWQLKGHAPRQTEDLYTDPAWLTRCYAAWNAYVRELVDARHGSRHITLEPYLDDSRGPSFRLIGVTHSRQ